MTMQLLNLNEGGQVLATRDRGREAADRVQEALDTGNALILNFANVEVASPSFLDEILTRLRGILTADGSAVVVVTGLNQDVSESLEMVLAHRKMVVAALKDDAVELIGGPRQLTETLAAASKLGKFKATELADELKIKLPNLHQRLKALTETGAVGRRIDTTATSGRRYDYFTFDPKEAKDLVGA